MAGWPGHEGEGEGGMRRKEDLPFSYVGRKQVGCHLHSVANRIESPLNMVLRGGGRQPG